MPGAKYDREFIVKEISKMRIKGKSSATIHSYLKEKYGMAKSTAYEIFKQAREEIASLYVDDIDKAYREAISLLEEEYENIPASDRRMKLEVRKELNKIQGLYRAQKVDVTSNGKDLTPTEIVVRIVKEGDDVDE